MVGAAGAAFLALVVLVPVAAEAQSNRNNAPSSRKGAASELPTVKKVDVEAKRITVGKKEYTVTNLTKITVDGEKATLADIEPGMQAAVTGGVAKYGRTKADTLYKATRIQARGENDLEKKRKEYNKKRQEEARRNNRNFNRNR